MIHDAWDGYAKVMGEEQGRNIQPTLEPSGQMISGRPALYDAAPG